MTQFLRAIDQLKFADKRRVEMGSPLPFGISYLDKATGGIMEDDLVVITARTGTGKSELATLISQSCLEQGKTVHLFALEAYRGEIESRLKFKILSEMFYEKCEWKSLKRVPNYHDWRRGKCSDLVSQFEKEASALFAEKYKNLFTCYRTANAFTPGKFSELVSGIFEETDLIILDHLHYFDFDTDNENSAIKATVKGIRQISEITRKPIILVAHVRKRDRASKSIVPDSEEIMGSSDIAKIATMIVAVAPAFDQPQKNNFVFPTYIRLSKNRDDSSRTRFVGLCGFNIRENKYEKDFKLGRLSKDENKLEEVKEWPQWARWDK